ncbi:hypothetical protein [Rhizobium phage RHEph16]|uniref:Uncharacterized protein n=1 Tax=Rhizobium phage RHEph16 TaxID=2836132 RepID=A0AAE8B4B2_9CAUD|nr:virion structural protein [Rhizobium phage RHEph16]QXV74379.1 hypothetical protein [Rhizobium phage RHEph16]
MAPLTWREVSAPNFSSVNQAQALVGDSISQAANIMQKSIAAYGDQKTRENSANFMGQILNGTPLDQVQGVNPAYLDPEAFNFALNVQKQNEANALGYARLAQLGAKGGKGKGTGAGTTDVIPVAPGSSDDNFLTSENQIIPGVVTNAGTDPANTKGKKQLIPTAPIVVAPAQGATQALPTVESFRPMPVDGPVRQSEEAAPTVNAPVAVDAAPTGATAATPLLAQAIASGQGIIAPTAGALRGAPVKGTDGGAQIFPELAQDVGRIRDTAYSGNPELANASSYLNQRVQNNLTATNQLDLQKGNYDAALTGQKFREGQRAEQEDVRKTNITQDGRTIGDAAVLQGLDVDSARAAIDPNLPPDVFAEAMKRVDQANRNGQFGLTESNRLQVAPDGTLITPGSNPATERANIIAGMTSTAEGAKSVQEATSTPEGAAKFNAAIDKALANNVSAGRQLETQELQHQADLRQYDQDRNSKDDISFVSDFAKSLKSDSNAGVVASQVMKNPRFEGSGISTNDMASVIERVAAQAKVSPAVAGGMVANSLRGNQPVRDWFKSFIWNKAELTYAPAKLQKLMDMAYDSETGKAKDDLLNAVSNLELSDKQRDNLNSSWETLKKAQNQYNKDVGEDALKNNGQTKNLVKMSERALAAATQQYQKDREKFLSVGGVARQNRGEPAPPPLAPPIPRPQQGPRQGTVYQPNADQLLQDAINKELSIPALDNKRRLGVY